MRNSDESVHGDGSRGSGRTHRQIASLHDGDYFIVHTIEMMHHASRIAVKLGRKIHIVVFFGRDWSSPLRLRGLPLDAWIETDHAAISKMSTALLRYIRVRNTRVTSGG